VRLAIIPARSGSRRLPGKNIRPFLGKPVIARAIETARRSGCFGEIMVSTDSEKIAGLARDAGAVVPFLRSAEASNEHATTIDVLREVLARYAQDGRTFESCCCLYPVPPRLPAGRLREAAEILEADPTIRCVFCALAYSHPAQRALIMDHSRARFLYPQFAATRTQDLPVSFHDAGQFYFFRPPLSAGLESLLAEGAVPLIVPPWEAHDIDTEEDWKEAERKHTGRPEA